MRLPCYDVLSEQEAATVSNVIDLYQLVLGRAMEASDLCGVITSGPMEQPAAQLENWGGAGISFGSFSEVWHVRSAPKGRMGLPLRVGEVRQVSVLIRKNTTERFARVANIKLWRLPTSQKLVDAASNFYESDEPLRPTERSTLTLGAVGLATYGLNLFESRAPADTSFAACDGCHTLLSAVATIARERDGKVVKIETTMPPHYVVSGCLAGLEMVPAETPDTRECAVQYTEKSWEDACELLSAGFHKLLLEAPRMRPILSEDLGLKLLFTAEDIFEQLSFIGYLDMRSDPFYKGSLPTDMSQPCGLALLLTIAVRVACNPEKWGLPETRWDDAYAVKEAALYVESIIPSVLSLGRDGAAAGEQQFTIDLVSQLAQKDIGELLVGLRSGELDKKHHNLDHNRLAKSLKQTMVFLQCAGVGVCVDLFGVPPPYSADGFSGAYTRYGLASQVADPVVESREQSAHAAGLGNLVDRWPTLRTSTRARRQLALGEVFVEVDGWLRTGKHNGTVLAPMTQPPLSVHLHELRPDPNPNSPPLPSTSAPSPASGSAAEPASTTAIRGVQRSTKKKNRTSRASGERVDAQAKLAERSKQRDAGQQQCAQQVIQSLFKPASRNDKRIEECCKKINGAAMSRGSGIFEYVLQLGACGGTSVLFNFASYLVTPTSAVRCAHCENRVHVVQSIAFAGSLGLCVTCGHPRCLACVARSMREDWQLECCHFCNTEYEC
jgi:hypothetical protein